MEPPTTTLTSGQLPGRLPPLPLPQLSLPPPLLGLCRLDEERERRRLAPAAAASRGGSNHSCASSCLMEGRFWGFFSRAWELRCEGQNLEGVAAL